MFADLAELSIRELGIAPSDAVGMPDALGAVRAAPAAPPAEVDR